MNDSSFSNQPSLVIIRLDEAAPATYSIETAAELVGVHPEMLRHYCKLGLLGEDHAHAEAQAELVFDDDALYELRRFEHYRQKQGINRKTLRLMCGLWREVERLQSELRFLRGR